MEKYNLKQNVTIASYNMINKFVCVVSYIKNIQISLSVAANDIIGALFI